jgi:hypothetical protein
MKPIMNINDLNTIEQMEQFLTGSQAVAFLVASSKDECYRAYSAPGLNSDTSAEKTFKRRCGALFD